jgi:hypothetical protein
VFLPVILYSIYEGFGVYEGNQLLKQQYPHCFKTPANVWYIFFGTQLTVIIASKLIEIPAEMISHKLLPESKFALGSKARDVKAKNIGERSFRLAVYIFFTVWNYFCLLKGGYLHTLMGGDRWNPNYYTNYPC